MSHKEDTYITFRFTFWF